MKLLLPCRKSGYCLHAPTYATAAAKQHRLWPHSKNGTRLSISLVLVSCHNGEVRCHRNNLEHNRRPVVGLCSRSRSYWPVFTSPLDRGRSALPDRHFSSPFAGRYPVPLRNVREAADTLASHTDPFGCHGIRCFVVDYVFYMLLVGYRPLG